VRHPGAEGGRQHAGDGNRGQRGQIDVADRAGRQIPFPAGQDVSERAGQRDRKAAGGAGGHGLMDRHVRARQERYREKAAAGADQCRQHADRAAGANHSGGSGQGPCGADRPVQEHLCGHGADEQAEADRQQRTGQQGRDVGTKDRADDDARREAPHDRPAHGTVARVGTHARQRGEQDGRERRGDGHLDDVIRREAVHRQQHRDERNQQHAAAEAEQARRESRAGAQQQERGDQCDGQMARKKRTPPVPVRPAS